MSEQFSWNPQTRVGHDKDCEKRTRLFTSEFHWNPLNFLFLPVFLNVTLADIFLVRSHWDTNYLNVFIWIEARRIVVLIRRYVSWYCPS